MGQLMPIPFDSKIQRSIARAFTREGANLFRRMSRHLSGVLGHNGIRVICLMSQMIFEAEEMGSHYVPVVHAILACLVLYRAQVDIADGFTYHLDTFKCMFRRNKMARNKFPEITRKRIMESAVRLFTLKGWNNVTIQDIVDDVGDITRGAFYHHFKSISDIIQSVTKEMMIQQDVFNNINDLENLNALDRLRQGIKYSILQSIKNGDQSTISREMISAEFVFSRITEGMRVVAPGIHKVIEEGNKDGSIQVAYPKQTAEIFTMLFDIWMNPGIFHVSREEFVQKIEHIALMFERIGMPIVNEELKNVFLELFDNVQEQ
ncbi:TetR/AcrR family transcriptional regulator [Paenibacillus popilliae]|uniref:TetR/AcrR family transcriptional regulator n=1 Tax=Paenibacillus popilliae TaxID=78057 RepID=A0ABY3ARE3_PAEPP|nr:TetR/AcrR family transcriptional regulator [Paenibacillus sp. SDF0028]TQR45152.1 TetR/AcrR family transcriptional regulator [Paenibacillus sp. SDF0028]